MRVPFSLLFLLVLLTGIGRAADRVGAEGGRIVFEDSSGQKTALTQTGLDSDPWISPNGRTVVFLRHSAEEVFRTSVYEIDMRTRTLRLLYGGPAKYQGRESSYFGRPEVDESRETLYMLSKEYATEGALISVQLANGQVKLISDHVVGYDIIVCPRYLNDLILLKRQDDILDHPFHLYWLYSPSGQKLRLAGSEQLNIDVLRDDRCGLPRLPEPVPSSPLPPSAGNAIRMDGSVMDRQLVTHVEPKYPSQARSERIQGDVRLQVRIAADGTVQEVSLVSGPPQLAAAAIAAVKQWRYRPVISSGNPIAVVTIVDVAFRLPSSDK